MVDRRQHHRLGNPSPEQYQAALDRFHLGTFVRAEPIMVGISKRNTFLTSTQGSFVLRGNTQFPWQYPTEQYFARQLHLHTTVPVADPYLVDLSCDTFGWMYAIMPRLPGLQLSHHEVRCALGSEEKAAIARAMGETLAQLQALVVPEGGRYDSDTGLIHPFDLHRELVWPFPADQQLPRATITYQERILARIRDLLARATSHNQHTTRVDSAWVEQLIERHQDALAVAFQPCFVMEDYKEQNVVVQCTNGVWNVSGVFDLMHAHYGDGEADLSRLLAMYLDEDPRYARILLDAYLSNRPPRPGFAERFVLYMLYDRLLLWEFFQRLGHHYPWQETLTLQQWATPYLECVSAEGG